MSVSICAFWSINHRSSFKLSIISLQRELKVLRMEISKLHLVKSDFKVWTLSPPRPFMTPETWWSLAPAARWVSDWSVLVTYWPLIGQIKIILSSYWLGHTSDSLCVRVCGPWPPSGPIRGPDLRPQHQLRQGESQAGRNLYWNFWVFPNLHRHLQAKTAEEST